MIKLFDNVLYGGDYNPDQWDDATIKEDMRLFKKANINLVTLPVFSWAKLEPDEGVYDFDWLDHILDIISENGISVNLATPTVAQPAWLSARYPEVLPVDRAGRKRTHGMRVFFCVNSLKYRERAAAIAEQMATRYKNHPALVMWHVANEYGTRCYCPTCEAQFRVWLRKRYGSIENLNKCWHTCFWGRTVYSFDEIYLPTELNDDYRFNPVIALDYERFLTASTIDCYLNEYNVLRKHTPDIPISTNMSGFIKKLNQFEFTKHMDYVGWDNYPWPTDPPHFTAFKHDLMRGLKDGASFLLAEQSPNQQNWQPYNKLKKPGEVRQLSYQAIARGADSCLFFQLRQSIGGQEKWHGAVIAHAGHENTRIFKECTQLGQELAKLGDTFLRGRTPAKVGMFFDWDSWNAAELSSGPSRDLNYLKFVYHIYKPFHEANIAIDVLHVNRDLSGYDVIVAPMLYMLKPGVAEHITKFVESGGYFIATTMTGLVDENDQSSFGEYPGQLKEVLGIWVEEIDGLLPDEQNTMVPVKEAADYLTAEYNCSFLCDVVHLRGAKALAVYGQDFYAGKPCATVNEYGKGKAFYIGTQPDDNFLKDLIGMILAEKQVKPPYQADSGIEVTERISKKGRTIFAINNNACVSNLDLGSDNLTDLLSGKAVTGRLEIAPRDVKVLWEDICPASKGGLD